MAAADQPNAAAAAEPPPLAGMTLWMAGILLALGNFMVVLDLTITNVSVPTIAGSLAVSPSQGTWAVTSYAVAEAITVPLSGWLARRFGAVRLFCLSIVAFGLFSLLCGFSQSLGMLVILRILQGLSGGPIMPLSQTLLQTIFPPKQRNAAMGIWSMTTVVGPIAGPLLGGVISDNWGWPWIFFINIPFAAACAFFVWRLLQKHETPTARQPVDFVGLGMLIVWVGAMQIMLDKGKDLDWFASPFIVALAVIAVIGFVAFLIWELTSNNPIVDLRVFRHRAFASGTLVMALTFGTFFSSVVLIPLWLQTSLGYDATWAGRAMAFQGVLAVVMSPIVAALVGRFDPRLLVSFGVAFMGLVSLWRSEYTMDVNFWVVAAPQLAQGFAMPFFFVSLMVMSLGALPPNEIASGSGLMNFIRTVAGAFGTSITTTAWENASNANRAQLAGRLNDVPGVTSAMSHGGLSHEQALSQVSNLLQGQAVMLATNHIFQICALTFFLGAAAAWIAPRVKRGGPIPSGH